MLKRLLYILGGLIFCCSTGFVTYLGLTWLSESLTQEKVVVSNLSDNDSTALSVIENSVIENSDKEVPKRENLIENEDDLYRVMAEKAFELSVEYEMVINSEYEFSRFRLHPKYIFLDDIKLAYIRNGAIDSGSQLYYTYQFICTYTDDFKVLRAFQNPELKKELTPIEMRLLAKANHILAQVIHEDMSDYDKELAIHDYLVLNGQYDLRALTKDRPDTCGKAEGILLNGMGSCESYARSANLLLNMAGVDCLYVVGEIIDAPDGHAWNKVNLDGSWYNLDVTWDDPLPDKPKSVGYQYFNITDAQLQKERTWEQEYYPIANAQEYNYFIYSGLVSKRLFRKACSISKST